MHENDGGPRSGTAIAAVVILLAAPASAVGLEGDQAPGFEPVDPTLGEGDQGPEDAICEQPVAGPALCRPVQTWGARYDGPGERDEDPSLAAGPDGEAVYVTAASHPEDGNFIARDYITLAYETTTGLQLWSARYDGPAERERPDEPAAIDVGPDGDTVYVTGTSDGGIAGGTREDVATIAYDADTGEERWVTRSNGPGGLRDEAHDLTVGPDGEVVFVTGAMHGGFDGGRDNVATIAYDADTGEERWRAFYDGPDDFEITEHGVGLVTDPDGETVFVAGTSAGDGTREDYVTIAHDADTGQRLWVARYDGAGQDDRVWALDTGPEGEAVFVTGTSWTDDTGNDHATIAYDAATGDQRWVARHDHAEGYDRAWDVEAGPSGSVFVTGEVDPADAYPDMGTFAYDADTGEERWMATYDGPTGEDDGGTALSVTPDGERVVVTGFSTGQGTAYDIATIAYDADTGAAQPAERYHGGEAWDIPLDLALSPGADSVYVAGESILLETTDVVTIGYERLGERLPSIPLEQR